MKQTITVQAEISFDGNKCDNCDYFICSEDDYGEHYHCGLFKGEDLGEYDYTDTWVYSPIRCPQCIQGCKENTDD